MGKKSREKRARRQHKAIKDALSNRSTLAIKQADDEFARQRAVLEAWLSEFNAEDACVSLCVSELWLPNISSQVKHTFAMGLLASIAPIRFNEAHRIETYPEFRDFVAQLNSRLPSFTMLEDYVPEADWGEVRIELGSSPLHSFYGGAVERISDFVTAFLMLHGETAAAHRDMLAALTIQDHVISNIDRSLVGSVTEIMPGHLEVPAELFWAACRKVLLSISDLPEALQVDVALVTTLGQFLPPRNRSEFGDAVMTGSALPTFLLEVGARRLPISLRDAPAAVIQLWAERSKDPNALVQTASATIGGFLGERFDRGRIVGGPLQLMTRTERLPYTFAAAMTGERQLYLVIAISEEDVQRLPAIEKAVKALLLSDDWGLRPEGAAHGLQLRRVDGTLPSPAEVELIVVPARLSTVPGILNLPKTSARVIPLSDFVTIFDSIEDLAELDRFWAFDEENSAVKGPYGLVDRFAAFRDSHALLADGAITPNLIALDPLWGSKWRYRQLEKSWANSPPLFPYGKSASWKTTREADGLFRLVGRAEEVLSWCAVVDHCVVHVLFQLKHDLKIDDGRMLELMVHCLADSLLQRNVTVAELPLFRHRRIVTICYVHRDIRTTLDDDDAEIDERPLFSDWSGSATPEGDVCARTQVNLRRLQQRMTEAADARFEAEAALSWIEGLNKTLGIALVPEETRASILATGGRKPRFTVKTLARLVDVPQFANPAVPGPEQYKIARRDLAIVFKGLNFKEGKYELAAAKTLVDPARDKFRMLVHERIATLHRDDLIAFCIEQLDALMGQYDTESTRIKLSLAHEVSYDRAENLAEAHDAFVKNSRNYRYLLECSVSARISGVDEVTEQKVINLVATIDWLHVLYAASDVLHNGIDAAGLELDHFFIPHVFYSEGWDRRETAFATETADLKLGLGVTPADAVHEIDVNSSEWQSVNAMFVEQVGVGLGQFLSGLLVLSRWPSANNEADLRWSYVASREQLRDVLVGSVEELDAAQADNIISLATLDPKSIRRLLGKSIDESDVPIWEHSKRGCRYTIKPLIAQEDDSFRWGAAATERAARIWRSSIASGYLPADFDWPKVRHAVRVIKEQLDDRLEVTAHAVVQRGTPYAIRGIDFMRRFPKKSFEDVGDYDVLAFWPEKNLWLVIECKYNQPAFCLKDARRLRDRIFGANHDRAQFAKIERRRAFLAGNVPQLRALLEWPKPPKGIGEHFSEVYVSRDLYWWMRNPPYNVPTQFVRVDVLDHWLRQVGLLA